MRVFKKTRLKILLFAALATAILIAGTGAAQAYSLSAGYDNTADLREIGKFRNLGGSSLDPWSGYNGFEAILGDGDLNPNVQIDFYRGQTDDGSTPYGHWNGGLGARNHVTVSYDKATGMATMTLAAQYNYTRQLNLGDLGLLNYLQLDVVGRTEGFTVDFNNVVFNGNSLGNFSGAGGWHTWNVTGLEFTNGFTLSGDIVLNGATMPEGGQELNKVVISAGNVVPIPGAFLLFGSGLLGLLGMRKKITLPAT